MHESLFYFIIGREVGGQKLKSNYTLELGVFGFVNDAHAAFTKLLKDTIM
jgi:hypothetical protein